MTSPLTAKAVALELHKAPPRRASVASRTKVILARGECRMTPEGRLLELIRSTQVNAAVLVICTFGLVVVASCDGERCTGANCALPPRFDLVVTESDSGGAGISTGAWSGVAFVLDSRRHQMATTPRLAVPQSGDSYRQFPGKSLFIVYPTRSGVFDVTATGGGMAAFTFHLVVGVSYPPWFSVVVHVGDIVVQEWGGGCGDGPPPALAAPAFALIQDESAVSTSVVRASLQFAFKRRAYRVLQLTGWPAPPSATPYAPGVCLPASFPRYPLMQYSGAVSATCSWDIAANDAQAPVLAFYKSQLDQGDWRIVSLDGSTIAFRLRDNYGFRGVVTVYSNGIVHVYVAAGPPTTCF
jgi:hypothetical protein